jgi:hypothetical protein
VENEPGMIFDPFKNLRVLVSGIVVDGYAMQTSKSSMKQATTLSYLRPSQQRHRPRNPAVSPNNCCGHQPISERNRGYRLTGGVLGNNLRLLQLSPSAPVGLPWASLLAFLRLVTNPRVFERPEPINNAWQQVRAWLVSESAWIPQPTERHTELLDEFLALPAFTAISCRMPISPRWRWSMG